MPLEQHASAFNDLAQHVRSVGTDPVIFVPSPGNWGDSLINAGTREFLREHHIAYRELRREELTDEPDLSGRHLLIGGGGGWCRFWHTTPELVDSLLPNTQHITVLPTSIADTPASPKQQDNLTIYSRGLTGLEPSGYDLNFCHDMAFHCTDGREPVVPSDRILNAFRLDPESYGSQAPKFNVDLSLQGNGFTDPRPLYHKLEQYTAINTDRLHLGIAASQIGIEVNLYPSSYPKIEGVFSYSMRQAFPNVNLHVNRMALS